MQPYINPNYFSNPIYGNYFQNTMPQAQVLPMGISGKFVNDFNEINASDISMNSPYARLSVRVGGDATINSAVMTIEMRK